MAELTLEQRRAIALAKARQRKAQEQASGAEGGRGAFDVLREMTGTTPPADMSIRGRLIDNIIGRDDGVMSAGEKVGAWLNKAGESATGGLMGDEADAAIESLAPGVSYDDRLQHHRKAQAQLETENPGLALGADVAGALLPIGGVGLATRGAGLAGRMAAGGLAGAGMGGMYGFMEGEGSEDRQRDAIVNALVGGGVGMAVPGVTSAARSVAGPFVEPVKAALGIGNTRRASRALGTAVERSGKSSEQLQAEIAKALAEGQPEFVLADALGHPGQRQLSSLARTPGPGRTEIVDFLEGRQTGQGDRLASFMGDSFGTQSAAKATEGLTQARGKAADVAYGAARKDAGPVDVRGALAVIDERIGPMQGSGVSGGPVDAKLAQFRSRLATEGKELSEFSRVLEVKKDAQDAIGEAVRAGRKNEARLLEQVVRELDAALETASGGYRKANDEFAKASRVIEAVDEGAEMARPINRAADNTARFSGMTPDEQAAARIGYGDRQLARLEAAAGPGTNRARPFTSSKSMQERAAMALDPGRLERRIDRENTMFETRRQAIGGSQTADNMADSAEGAGFDASAIANILSGNVGTGLRQILTSASRLAKGENEETRQIIARALLSRDPQEVLDKAMKQTGSDATRRALVDALLSAAGQKGGYLMVQNP